ncbi:ADP-ribose pyrophosphatase YjhB, NUDIX family [Ruminococcus albus]|uniref:ADP-ribose pyrophosphatase YjhB, NUDIX family n=1 Tax=Ruminococcus albus TaxID=1264 RepID=A0A1I1P1E3_RUMAL|nr:ADP-ribose pyrophosphatase YjhB, NUDIX family [Ruminococcus albus]
MVFGIDSIKSADKKTLDTKKLKLLLVRRGEEPFMGSYSLPGGFLRKGETIEEAAIRELKEEAGVNEPKLINLGVYSKPQRDPRGWIISCCFIALTNTVELSTAAGSDAESAHWLDLEATNTEDGLTLKLHDDGEVVYEYSCGGMRSDKLAFDHGEMILDAFLKLRDEVINHDMIFGLMPEYFTISDLQQPYEAITGIHLSPQGFRKKVIGKLAETELFDEAAAHRTSRLYRKA